MTGYHICDVAQGDRWILEPGIYWASEGSVNLGVSRDPFLASLWVGDGWVNWKTSMAGSGRVAINPPGPVECIGVKDGELKVQGRLVLGRTYGLKFSSQRSARHPRNLFSGQQRLRVFSETGKVLVSWTSYWTQFMYERMAGEQIESSIFEHRYARGTGIRNRQTPNVAQKGGGGGSCRAETGGAYNSKLTIRNSCVSLAASRRSSRFQCHQGAIRGRLRPTDPSPPI